MRRPSDYDEEYRICYDRCIKENCRWLRGKKRRKCEQSCRDYCRKALRVYETTRGDPGPW